MNFGEPIVEFLVAKPQIELPNELDGGFLESIVIDTVNKLIIIDKSEYDLWEQACEKWDSYKFQMGDFGYIGLLIRAQIDSGNVIMPEAKIKQEFAEMIAQQTDFDPDSLAKGLMGTSRNIEFNPDFFDNVKPKKTISERIKSFISKLGTKKG